MYQKMLASLPLGPLLPGPASNCKLLSSVLALSLAAVSSLGSGQNAVDLMLPGAALLRQWSWRHMTWRPCPSSGLSRFLEVPMDQTSLACPTLLTS